MTINNIKIIPYKDRYEDKLKQHLQYCWRVTYEPILGKNAADDLVASIQYDMRAVVPGHDEMAFLIWDSNKVVGSIILAEEGKTAFIWGMYIHPDYQRKGLGKRLVQYATSLLKTANVIQIFVLKKRPDAQRFYEALGFTCNRESRTELIKDVQVEMIIMSIAVERLLQAA